MFREKLITNATVKKSDLIQDEEKKKRGKQIFFFFFEKRKTNLKSNKK